VLGCWIDYWLWKPCFRSRVILIGDIVCAPLGILSKMNITSVNPVTVVNMAQVVLILCIFINCRLWSLIVSYLKWWLSHAYLMLTHDLQLTFVDTHVRVTYVLHWVLASIETYIVEFWADSWWRWVNKWCWYGRSFSGVWLSSICKSWWCRRSTQPSWHWLG